MPVNDLERVGSGVGTVGRVRPEWYRWRGSISSSVLSGIVLRVGSVEVDRGGGGGPGNWTERRDSDRLTAGGGGGGIDVFMLELGFGDGERRDEGGVGRGIGWMVGRVDVLTSRRGVLLVEEGGVGNGAGVREAGIV